ncbi:DUF6653 family protein [Ruegeria sp. MALMAid1280]|uniref:DUF6653 family protein n=1 Tax=Ruegeria sp. MALMAid1280 TaxID=3411634 RepID=UPI003B9E6C6B
MDIAELSARLMGMDDTTWQRHANPWSGWSRMTILPLICLAIWSRIWLGWGALWLVLAVVIWTWLNPRLFGPPQHHDAWMTKGVLGERIWLNRKTAPIPIHHAQVIRLLTFSAALGVAILAIGLWRLELSWVIVGLTLAIGAKLWFLDRMVWLLADTSA